MSVALRIFEQFLWLGLVSFGGPAAHLGYFHRRFVEQLQWLTDAEYAQLVSLSQFLPGPGSSQVGFAIGLHRGGWCGGVAAFLGFTLPSAVLMFWLATTALNAELPVVFSGIIAGLKILAVVVVAEAIWGMSQRFCQTRRLQALALVSAMLLLAFPGMLTQIAVLVAAGLAALLLTGRSAASADNRPATEPMTSSSSSLRRAWRWNSPLLWFAALWLLLPVLARSSAFGALFADFYYAGSLVFGGGHVVLPLLQESVGEVLTADQFLTGYAAAQAVPGPMFSLAVYLGADMTPSLPLAGALLAAAGIFLPGCLLMAGLRQRWQALANRPRVVAVSAGINAAVVGLLIAAFYQPVFISAVHQPVDMAMVLLGFILLKVLRLPIGILVLTMALLGVLLAVVV